MEYNVCIVLLFLNFNTFEVSLAYKENHTFRLTYQSKCHIALPKFSVDIFLDFCPFVHDRNSLIKINRTTCFFIVPPMLTIMPPKRKLNGFLLANLLTPSSASPYTHLAP